MKPNLKILLVDDSMPMRRIQKNILNKLGINSIEEARDGQKALEKLRVSEPPIDAVLLDLNMPNVNGFTCLRNIRSNKEFDKIKILICTSEMEKAKIIQALTAGANSYIVKPFTYRIIQSKFHELGLI